MMRGIGSHFRRLRPGVRARSGGLRRRRRRRRRRRPGAAGQPAAGDHLARRPPTRAENSAGTIYTATATDPDGNPLTFSLSGGADRAAFAITAGRRALLRPPPDFEAPTDADGNNVYLVQLAVSDGTTSATLDLAVTVTNAGAGRLPRRPGRHRLRRSRSTSPRVPDGIGPGASWSSRAG